MHNSVQSQIKRTNYSFNLLMLLDIAIKLQKLSQLPIKQFQGLIKVFVRLQEGLLVWWGEYLPSIQINRSKVLICFRNKGQINKSKIIKLAMSKWKLNFKKLNQSKRNHPNKNRLWKSLKKSKEIRRESHLRK